jgi:hypothetical protein
MLDARSDDLLACILPLDMPGHGLAVWLLAMAFWNKTMLSTKSPLALDRQAMSE